MAIQFEIERPVASVFRRCSIKRRSSTTGLYESSWYDVTEFIKSWGTFRRTVDDLRLNLFTHSGVTLTMRNDTGAFNREDNSSSLWKNYLTRYRTLVKIEAGYVQDDSTELPTDTSVGVFILADEIPIDAQANEATLQCRSLVSVFDEVRAADVVGITGSLTADQIVARIRDHTDGSGNFIFRQFITSTAWTIQSTTNYYNLTTSVLGSMSVWSLMTSIAESESFLLFITRTGGFEFRDRNERTSTSQFTFRGLGFPDPTIIEMKDFREALNKFFNFFRLQFKDEDTTTSFVTAGVATSVDPSNTAWKYGARVYEFSNSFFGTSTVAQVVVNNLLDQFSSVKNECQIRTKFVPHLEISDKVLLSYRSYDIVGATLWDLFNWDEADWATEGDNFDLTDAEFKVISIQTDLNKFVTTFTLREI
jgi:hypothetical protein